MSSRKGCHGLPVCALETGCEPVPLLCRGRWIQVAGTIGAVVHGARFGAVLVPRKTGTTHLSFRLSHSVREMFAFIFVLHHQEGIVHLVLSCWVRPNHLRCYAVVVYLFDGEGVWSARRGVLFSVMLGLWVLLLAEVLHYVIHYQVPRLVVILHIFAHQRFCCVEMMWQLCKVHYAYKHLSRAKA